MALINTTTTGVLGSTIFGDGTGPLTVQQNGVTLGIFGNQPAFYVAIGTNQSISSGTITKLQFNTETFDTNSNYDTTNYRFLPTVAGYYQINLNAEYSAQTGIQNVSIYKNGSRVASGAFLNSSSAGTGMSSTSVLTYLNGTTDYVEAYGYTTSASTCYAGSSSQFSGCLIRAA